MYEKKQGKTSFWYPYIRELDRQRGRGQLAVESPLLWSKAELDYLTGSPTKVSKTPLLPALSCLISTVFNVHILILNYHMFSWRKVLSLHIVMIQAEVLERAEGIKREYNELDTVWFMAGSLFQASFCN